MVVVVDAVDVVEVDVAVFLFCGIVVVVDPVDELTYIIVDVVEPLTVIVPIVV